MNDVPRVWSTLSAEEHELQYNPREACPNFADFGAAREPANAAALAQLEKVLDVPYGDHPLRRLDIFPAAPSHGSKPPVHVFLHGGYWRAQDKASYAWIAGMLVPRGVTTVIANYELCPASTLDGVVDSALAAVAWVLRNIADHGGDAGSITLSGHSAGAHLGAEVLATDWHARGIDPRAIRGAMLVSGIFDPAPAMATSVNADLHLTPELATRHDVERRPVLVDCPVHLFAGGLEPWQWIDQTFRYSHHLRRGGRDPEVHVLPGHNHFGILDGFADPDKPIGSAILKMAAEGRSA
jgi:arylformamidase